MIRDAVLEAADILRRRPGRAIWTTASPMLVLLGMAVLLAATNAVTGPEGPDLSPLLLSFVPLTLPSLLALAGAWGAVAWHRYVLLGEAPGWLPRFAVRPIWSYVWRSLVLYLAVASVARLLLALLGPWAEDPSARVFLPFAQVPVVWLALRLSLTLPAHAIDRPLSFAQSWAATRGHRRALFALAVALTALSAASSWALLQGIGQGLAAGLLALGLAWLAVLLNLSILASLYGHLVERRPLR